MRLSKARGVEGIIPCVFPQIWPSNTLRFFTDSNILYLALFYNSRVREAIKALVEDGRYDYIKTCFDKKIEVERDIHQKAMLLIKQYMIVTQSRFQ